MRRHRTVIVCGGLALLMIGAMAVQGTPVVGRMLWSASFGKQAPPITQITVSPTSTPTPKERIHPVAVDLSWWVILGAVVVMTVVALLLWRAMQSRRQLPRAAEPAILGPVDDGDLEPEPQQEPQRVRRGLDLALDVLAGPREPRDAIEQAWLGLQDAAEESGIRRLPAETPSEFTARVLSRIGADRPAARVLLDLYLRVRFGGAPVTENDVAAARRSLETLRASWVATPTIATTRGAGR